MDNNPTNPEQEENLGNPGNQTSAPATATEASTSRRAITAILVLTAALLLGYVLYDVLMSHPSASQVVEQPAPLDENPVKDENTEYSDSEKTAILEAMSEAEVELTASEVEERRAILGAMGTDSDDETSEEERKAILEAMQ